MRFYALTIYTTDKNLSAWFLHNPLTNNLLESVIQLHTNRDLTGRCGLLLWGALNPILGSSTLLLGSNLHFIKYNLRRVMSLMFMSQLLSFFKNLWMIHTLQLLVWNLHFSIFYFFFYILTWVSPFTDLLLGWLYIKSDSTFDNICWQILLYLCFNCILFKSNNWFLHCHSGFLVWYFLPLILRHK